MLLGACEINTGAVRSALNKLVATLDNHTGVQPSNEQLLLETANTVRDTEVGSLGRGGESPRNIQGRSTSKARPLA